MHTNNYKTKITTVILAIIALVVTIFGYAEAILPLEKTKQNHSSTSKKPEPSHYIAGQIIIQLKDTVQDPQSKNGSSQTAASNRDKILNQLKQKYKFQKFSSLFSPEEQTQSRTAQAKSLSLNKEPSKAKKNYSQTIKEKYPQRSKRSSAKIDTPNPSLGFLIEFASSADVEKLAKVLSEDPSIEYACPNYICQLLEMPNDPFYRTSRSWGQNEDDLWGLKAIRVEQTWDLFAKDGRPGYDFAGKYVSGERAGEPVVVAVVDSGVDYNHPDIWDNIWVNPAIINDVNEDGKIDLDDCDTNHNHLIEPEEIHGNMFGWNYCDNNNQVMDVMGHGSHVAGIIAATGNNNLGIIGVAPQAKIMPIRIFNSNGTGSLLNVKKAFQYAIDNGADIINNSWGLTIKGSDPTYLTPEKVDPIFKTLEAAGMVVVFAAGNSGDDANFFIYVNQPNPKPIVVAATTPEDELTSFSNFGNPIDIGAPGGGNRNIFNNELESERNILSLKASQSSEDISPPELIVEQYYLRQAGTSMAAPFISGLAALVLSRHPDFTTQEVLSVIRAGAELNTPGPIIKYNRKLGYGRANALRTLEINSPCVAMIHKPLVSIKKSVIGTTLIEGTVGCRDFNHYDLEYERGLSPQTWITIPSTLAGNKVSADWDTRVLLNDFYTIRLSVFNQENQGFEAFRQITVNNGLTDRPLPDLAVTQFFPEVPPYDINAADFTVEEGTQFYLTATVTNQGESTAGPQSLLFYILEPTAGIFPEQRVIDRISLPALSRGETITLVSRAPWDALAVGNNKIMAEVDKFNEVYESDEDNFEYNFSTNLSNNASKKSLIVNPDITPPQTSISGVDNLWHKAPVIISLAAADTGLGVKHTFYSTNGGAPTTEYTKPFSLSSEGIYTIKFYSTDWADNAEDIQTAAYQVKIDTTAPTATIRITNAENSRNNQYVRSRDIKLALQASDNVGGSGVNTMQFSNDGANWSRLEYYVIARNWNLSVGDGQKTVYAKLFDRAGNFVRVSTSVLLDTTPPSVPQNPRIANVTTSGVTLAWEASRDTLSQVAYRIYRNGAIIAGTILTSFSDGKYNPINLNTDNVYEIQAYDYSPSCNASAKTTPLVVPAAPSNAVAVQSSTIVLNVNWKDNSNKETGFQLEYGTDRVNFKVLTDKIPANGKGVSILGLNSGKTYYFRVCALKNVVKSAYSNVASVTMKKASYKP